MRALLRVRRLASHLNPTTAASLVANTATAATPCSGETVAPMHTAATATASKSSTATAVVSAGGQTHSAPASTYLFALPSLSSPSASPSSEYGANTICVKSGTVRDPVTHGVISPVFTATASKYPNSHGTVFYARYSTQPNQHCIAAKVAALDGAEAGLVFASGMAAVSNALLCVLRTGDHVIFHSALYGGTAALVSKDLANRGIEYTLVFGTTRNDFEKALRPTTRVVYFESPTNPLCDVLDIAMIASFARDHSLTSVFDGTFATPILQRPIALGVDVVVHSATKLLNGHSDLCAGVVVGSAAYIAKCQALQFLYGGTLNSADCYQLERGMKTLALRVRQQSTTALALAKWFVSAANSKRIRRVHYPGLVSHAGHAIAKKQMTGGFGSMLALEFACDADTAHAVCHKLRITELAVSLGGVESTCCFPAETSHAPLSRGEREAMGISDSTLRLSVGIEDVADLIADWDQALAIIKA